MTGRQDEVDRLLERAAAWSRSRGDVRATALVGSWARGAATATSDVDIVVLVDDPAAYLDDEQTWVAALAAEDAPVVRRQAWGPLLTERRLRLASGLEVEVGFATPAWAATGPVDPGTARVVADGCRILHDPDGLLTAAQAELARTDGERGGSRPLVLLLTAVIVLLLVVGVSAADRPRVRAAEAAYLEGRQVTACATRRLAPFANETRELDELPAALEEIVVEARAEAEAVRAEADDLATGLLPRTRQAVRAVQAALEAEVVLYEGMVEDPTADATDDALRRLGTANARAEDRLDAARRWVLAGTGDRWDDRFRCVAPAPATPQD
jgi:predicted nucleotidyltransferase